MLKQIMRDQTWNAMWWFISSQQRATRKTQSTPCLTVEKVLELIKVSLLFPHYIVMNQYWPMLKFVSISSCRRHHWKRCRKKWRSSCPMLTVKICSSLWGTLHRLLCLGALQIHPFTPQTSWSSWCAPSFSVTGKHCHGIPVWMWTNDTLPVFSQKNATLFLQMPPTELFIHIIMEHHHCPSSSWPQQCVSRPFTSGFGEKGLLFVPALSPVFPRHPWSHDVRLSKGLYQVTIGMVWIVHFLTLCMCNSVLFCLGGAVCQMLMQKKWLWSLTASLSWKRSLPGSMVKLVCRTGSAPVMIRTAQMLSKEMARRGSRLHQKGSVRWNYTRLLYCILHIITQTKY